MFVLLAILVVAAAVAVVILSKPPKPIEINMRLSRSKPTPTHQCADGHSFQVGQEIGKKEVLQILTCPGCIILLGANKELLNYLKLTDKDRELLRLALDKFSFEDPPA